MAEWGWFNEQRVMLIDGEILVMATQKSPHSIGIALTADFVGSAFGVGFWVRQQMPLVLEGVSDTEPDIAVVRGSPRDYLQGHPRTALLVVEVSDTTLRFDRTRKASLNARGGIADYWVLNLVDRQLEVYRNPLPAEAEPFGYRYADQTILRPGESIAPLAMPTASIEVADLLP
jgi:Uma2 family endonuclease